MSRAIGKTPATTATTEVPVEATTYTEQATGAQRSISSSSASDAAAGTGARTVRITYYALAADGVTVTGPFQETVTLNGTTPVNTVSTTICYIERMDVLTAGSGGTSAGTLSLYTAITGGGSVFASIAAGDPCTYYAHHYVPSNSACHVLDIAALGGNATSSTYALKAKPPGGVEQIIFNGVAASSVASVDLQVADADHQPIPGPTRLRLYATPANTTSQVNFGSFAFRDERAVLTS